MRRIIGYRVSNGKISAFTSLLLLRIIPSLIQAWIQYQQFTTRWKWLLFHQRFVLFSKTVLLASLNDDHLRFLHFITCKFTTTNFAPKWAVIGKTTHPGMFSCQPLPIRISSRSANCMTSQPTAENDKLVSSLLDFLTSDNGGGAD